MFFKPSFDSLVRADHAENCLVPVNRCISSIFHCLVDLLWMYKVIAPQVWFITLIVNMLD